ncbi:hypothetical protein ALP63_101969 [Pseudomonas syringae pv. aceris]|nr:hypothetical protein ALP63_101969 [Pseudomonas syringae pv. aceris]RMS65059.1 hypothetical protein ALP62_101932 [Pseudomonas syringae pv. aceris]
MIVVQFLKSLVIKALDKLKVQLIQAVIAESWPNDAPPCNTLLQVMDVIDCLVAADVSMRTMILIVVSELYDSRALAESSALYTGLDKPEK